MEVDQDHVQTLLSMGFPNESDVRKALRLAKNSLNDAVAILTNDHPTTNFDTLDEIDVEMKDLAKGSSDPVYGPNLPPTYDEAVSSDVSWTNNTRKNPWVVSGLLGAFYNFLGVATILESKTIRTAWPTTDCRSLHKKKRVWGRGPID